MLGLFKKKIKMYKDIQPEEFDQLMQQDDAVVLDVRTEGEIYDGVIEGYKLINLYNPHFMEEIQKLDKSKTYLIYCRSGNRSGMACGLMAQMGFEKLYNLEGGMFSWSHYQRMKKVAVNN